MKFKLCKSPRRGYVHRRSFASQFVHTPKPLPFKYWLNSREVRDYYGITKDTQLKWVASWKSTDFTSGDGPRPIAMKDTANPNGFSYRYEWDSIMNPPRGEDWLSIFKRNRAEWIEQDKSQAVRTRTASA